MANVGLMPLLFDASTSGLRALGSPATFPTQSVFSEIAWPLRLRIQGTIIGTALVPPSPIVLAIGIPNNICVQSISPLTSESRTAAQLAGFTGSETIPYFLNNPFSCAIANGEQSVKAMKPKLTLGFSGASDA